MAIWFVVLTSSMLLLLFVFVGAAAFVYASVPIASLSLCGAHKTSSAGDDSSAAAFRSCAALAVASARRRQCSSSAMVRGSLCPLMRGPFKRRPSVQAVSKCWLSSFCSDFCKNRARPRATKRNSNQMTDNFRIYSIDCITANHR